MSTLRDQDSRELGSSSVLRSGKPRSASASPSSTRSSAIGREPGRDQAEPSRPRRRRPGPSRWLVHMGLGGLSPAGTTISAVPSAAIARTPSRHVAHRPAELDRLAEERLSPIRLDSVRGRPAGTLEDRRAISRVGRHDQGLLEEPDRLFGRPEVHRPLGRADEREPRLDGERLALGPVRRRPPRRPGSARRAHRPARPRPAIRRSGRPQVARRRSRLASVL